MGTFPLTPGNSQGRKECSDPAPRLVLLILSFSLSVSYSLLLFFHPHPKTSFSTRSLILYNFDTFDTSDTSDSYLGDKRTKSVAPLLNIG